MQKTIKKIAVANRGEIAVRIISACREMSITPVLLYSSADKNSLAYRMSTKKVCLKAPQESSYLNVSAVVEGALSAGAAALHPGYGFLSEKAELAEACRKNNIVFIGPPEHCLKIFGDKRQARAEAQKCGLPTLPAYSGHFTNSSAPLLGSDAVKKGADTKSLSLAKEVAGSKRWLKEARKMGFPVMIKSAKGGGGRGLKLVFSEKRLARGFSLCQKRMPFSFWLFRSFY